MDRFGYLIGIWIRLNEFGQGFSPSAMRYSQKFIGNMCLVSILPTGKDALDFIIPRREPAHATCSSGMCSWKYFKEVIAGSHSWISSIMSRVSPATILTLFSNSISRIILDGSMLLSNNSFSSGTLRNCNRRNS